MFYTFFFLLLPTAKGANTPKETETFLLLLFLSTLGAFDIC